MDGIHDMGGMAGFGPVVPDERGLPRALGAPLFALTRVVPRGGHHARATSARRSSRCRRTSTSTPTYYERWMYGLERRLERAGSLAPGDLDEALARVQDAPAARAERSGADRARARDPAQREAAARRRRAALRAGRRRARAPHAAGGPHALPALRPRCSRRDRAGARRRPAARCRRARQGRPGRGGLRGALPLRGPLRSRARSPRSACSSTSRSRYLEEPA